MFSKKSFFLCAVMLFHISSGFAMQSFQSIALHCAKEAIPFFREIAPAVATAYLTKKNVLRTDCEVREIKNSKNENYLVLSKNFDGQIATMEIVFDKHNNWNIPNKVSVKAGSAVIEMTYTLSGDSIDILHNNISATVNYHELVNDIYKKTGILINPQNIRKIDELGIRFTKETIKKMQERFVENEKKAGRKYAKKTDLQDAYFDGKQIVYKYSKEYLQRLENERRQKADVAKAKSEADARTRATAGFAAKAKVAAKPAKADSKAKAEKTGSDEKDLASSSDDETLTEAGDAEPPIEDPDKKPEDEDKKSRKLTPEQLNKLEDAPSINQRRPNKNKDGLIKRIRGTAKDAYEFFKNQVKNGEKIKQDGDAEVWKDENGVTWTYRERSTNEPYCPTIDIKGIPGIEKIKWFLLSLATGASATSQTASAQSNSADHDKSYDEKETKTSAAFASTASSLRKPTQKTKTSAQDKPAPMDLSDSETELDLKPNKALAHKSGGPMCGGDGKVAKPLKTLQHRMSHKQIGCMAPSKKYQLEEDGDSNSDDDTGFGLTAKSRFTGRPGASMSAGSRKGGHLLTTLNMRMPSKQIGLVAPPKPQKQKDEADSDGDASMSQPKLSLQESDPFSFSQDRSYVPSDKTPKDELYRVAEKILNKPEHKRTDQDQQFLSHHPDIARAVAKGLEISSDDEWDDKKSSRSSHQQGNYQAMEESDSEESDTEMYDEARKLEVEKNRRLEAEVNAHRKEKQDLFDAKIGIDNAERIHRIASEKRSVSDAAEYNRIAPHISSFIKTFNKKLKRDLKTALKKSPKERDKDEKALIHSHPDKIKEIQEEELEKEKLLKKKEKTYAKITKKSMQAAALTRLMKYYNEQEANYKEKIDKIREDMWDRKMLGIQSQELYKISVEAREAYEKKRSFFADRSGAISRTLDNPNTSSSIPYTISNIPLAYKDIINKFTKFTGSPAQEQVHDELVLHIISNNKALYNEQYENSYDINKNGHVANIATFVFHFADIARQYNMAGKIEQAFALIDVCSHLVDVENAYVSFMAKYEYRFAAGVFSIAKTAAGIFSTSQTINIPVEFGKKLDGYVTKYNTNEISAAMNKAVSSLSKALQLTYDDSNDFDEKILADAPAILQALKQGVVGTKKRLVTFATNRFFYGSALGLKSSDYTKRCLLALVEIINNEKTITAQANQKLTEHRQMLSPIITIFRQALEDALKAAQERLDQKESDQADSDQEMSEEEAPEIKKPDQTKSDAHSSSDSSNHGIKRTHTQAKKTKKPATKPGAEDKKGVAPMMDVPEEDHGADDSDEDDGKDSIGKRVKKRARYQKQSSDEKEAKIPGNVHDVKIAIQFQGNSITQFKSIDQNTYEENELLNLFGGNLMCGHFSAFNGSRMLDIACGRNPEQAQQDMLSDEAFNAWLLERREIIEAYEHEEVGNIFGNHIERLLEASNDTFYTDNTSIIEIANIRDSFVHRNGQAPLFLPADNALVEQINYFRESKAPQLVILNTGIHWICMVFGHDWMWAADSLNNDQTHDAEVNSIRDLFTTQQIPAVADLEQLRNQYRNVPKSAAARNEEKRAQPKTSHPMLLRSIVKNKKVASR